MATEQKEPQGTTAVAILPVVEQDVAAVKRMMAGLQTLLKDVLVQGLDYGTIPGTQKPTLLKPGSEKILGMLNCAAEVSILEKVEDYKEGFFSYTVKVTAAHRGTGQVFGEGVGSANTKEKRYQRKDGTWNDPFGLTNTVLKMAKKRAQLDCALTVGMASEMFTQDMDEEESAELATPKQVALILKMSRSHVVTEDEQKKTWTFCEGNPTKSSAEKMIDRLKAMLSERKESPKGGDSESQAYDAARDLETDIGLGDVDLGDAIAKMLKHSAFGGDVAVLAEIDALDLANFDGPDGLRTAQIDVARTMRDALIGVPATGPVTA